MLLAIDVGNTNVTFGVYDDDKLLFVSRMATNSSLMQDQYAVWIRQILHLHGVHGEKITGAIVSSVVPRLAHDIPAAIKLLYGVECILVSKKTVTQLEVITENPNEIGADLLVDCVAAKAVCKCPCIVIDMGTATKLLVLDKLGRFCGAVITPGVGVSFEALVSNAALLSSVEMRAPKNVMGLNTTQCLQSGIIHGSAAMIDGLCDRIEKEIGEACSVIATGGFSREIVKNCSRDIIYSETLLIDGLKIIYDEAVK